MKRFIISIILLFVLAGCAGTTMQPSDGGIGGTGSHISQDMRVH